MFLKLPDKRKTDMIFMIGNIIANLALIIKNKFDFIQALKRQSNPKPRRQLRSRRKD